MVCERFREQLDAYIDGMLGAEEMREFMDHAKACEACGEELRAAEALRDMMKNMDDGVAVPLQAQAAWRNAVRTEAKKMRMRRSMRVVYAACAALVLFVGVTVAMDTFNGTDEALPQAQPLMMSRAVTTGLIERDGAQMAAADVEEAAVYSAVKKIEAENYEEACKTLSLLCEEYSAGLALNVSETVEGKKLAEHRIEISSEYLDDFLNAASRIGTETASEINEFGAQTAVVLVQICEK